MARFITIKFTGVKEPVVFEDIYTNLTDAEAVAHWTQGWGMPGNPGIPEYVIAENRP